MTTVKIELPDQQVAALKARATAQGLTLEDWISRKLAEPEAPTLTTGATTGAPRSDEDRAWMEAPERGSVVERMRQLRARVKPDPEGWTIRDYINYGRQ